MALLLLPPLSLSLDSNLSIIGAFFLHSSDSLCCDNLPGEEIEQEITRRETMALLLHLFASILILVTKPFSLCNFACTFAVRVVLIVIYTWTELLIAALNFHLDLFRKSLIWTFALVTFPMRILSALPREKMLELQLGEMQTELENLVWDMKQLEGNLRTSLKEQKLIELMLAEVEDENDKAIAKIKRLEGELHFLKQENLKLKEIQGKLIRNNDSTGLDDSDNSSSFVISSDLVKRKPKLQAILETDNDVDLRDGAPFSQSVFSAVLSVLVGIIIWYAEEPCMPLVMALFTVVGMSLKKVVEFLSTVENKPASDAVALLSINWFILGTLSYPTLPKIARMLTPVTSSL